MGYGIKSIPDCDCVEFRAVRGKGVVMVAKLKGYDIARTSLTFAEAQDMGAQLFELGADHERREHRRLLESMRGLRQDLADVRRSIAVARALMAMKPTGTA